MRNNNYYKIEFDQRMVCVIIPTYNNSTTLNMVIDKTLNFTDNIIVINDGSTDNTKHLLQEYSNRLHIINFERNRGKGWVLRKGFKYAIDNGFRYAVTIDSDAQHFPEDLPVFLKALKENPNSIIIGSRDMKISNIPKKSKFGHKFSNFWFRVETGVKLNDTQSGYRLYPLEKIKSMKLFTNKYEFEIEILVRSAWNGVNIFNIPINIDYYPLNKRISHFRPGIDFTRVSILNTVFVLLSILYFWPKHFIKKVLLNKEKLKKIISESLESNLKISLAIALGVLMGIVPVWGFQTIAAMILATLFRLNRLIVLIFCNVSIPPMIPIIILLSLKTGSFLMKTNLSLDLQTVQSSLNIKAVYFTQYLIGSFVFAIMSAIFVGLVSYVTLTIYRNKK